MAPPMQVRQLTDKPKPAQNELMGVILPGGAGLSQARE